MNKLHPTKIAKIRLDIPVKPTQKEAIFNVFKTSNLLPKGHLVVIYTF